MEFPVFKETPKIRTITCSMNHNKHNNIYATPSPLKGILTIYKVGLQVYSSISNTMYFLKNIKQNNVFHSHVPYLPIKA